MQSSAPDVPTYLQQVPDERQECLATLRQLCRKTLVGYSEGMHYGMPSYTKDGVVEVAFASQRNYISLYISKQAVVDIHRDDLRGLSVGKGCIRYSRPGKMDFAVVEKLLVATRNSQDVAC